MQQLSAWLMTAMVTWVPPRGADVERYESIAQDFARVAEEAPLFPTDGPARTALLMASIASYESSYRADIDKFRVKGDHGRSLGLMQIQLRAGESCDDRIACLRIARERIRESLDACRSLPFNDRLAVYATGHCNASPASRWRIGRALGFWKKSPFIPASGEEGATAAAP